MAEEQDEAQKTEEPTPKKLQEAHKKGQVITSQEVKSWFILLGLLLVLALFMPYGSHVLMGALNNYMTQLHMLPVDAGALIGMFADSLVRLLVLLGLLMALFMVLAVAASLVMHGWVMSGESLKPTLNKISPLAGFKRLFSLKSVVEFLKGVGKLAIIGGLCVAVVYPELSELETLPLIHPSETMDRIWIIALKLVGAVLAILTIIAALDYVYQRFTFLKQMRMTKQEVKDENKQTEGDPMVKGRLRQIRMERARQRMMASVPEADVVITNPTHYAVALKYDPDSMEAPRCLAKGMDSLALRIRELATENDVAIVENPPLARALHQAVEVDREIPPEHYKAVAEVISYVFRLQRRAMPAA